MITGILKHLFWLNIIFTFKNADGVRTKLVAFEKCSTTNAKGFVFNVCAYGPKGTNVSYTVGEPTEQVVVSIKILNFYFL